KVFGIARAEGIELAHHLGRALQLTNIARDIDEDAELGRLYLPREALDAAGITTTEPKPVVAHPAIAAVVAPVLARAESHFAAADAVMARCPPGVVRAPRLMSQAYQVLRRKLIARGFAPPRPRVRIGRWRLLWLLVRY